MTIYAYLRISTDKQSLNNQAFEIQKYVANHNICIDSYIEEVISSRKKLQNRKLAKLLKRIKPDDIIITTEISRLGRSVLEIMNILQLCLSKKCKIITLKENYVIGDDLQSKVLAFAFGVSAEIERQLISQRTKESLQRLKAEGKHLGRPVGGIFNKLYDNKNEIKQLLDNNTPKLQISKMINCPYSTLYRFIKCNL